MNSTKPPPYVSGYLMCFLLWIQAVTPGFAQFYDPPPDGAPGDAMIQAYLAGEAQHLHAAFTNDIHADAINPDRRSALREEYFHMLGLWPLPERTPLQATVTSTIEGDGYVVDMIHYQSRPRLYVTGNLYRPASVAPGERLPAVFYVCGHSYQGRSGNKTAYQSHGIWFARHGYICLVVDSLQLGEIAAIHHGTYRENRWWWHSRGYTPAGVECWNGIRGIDYLQGRPDVDPDRIAVTGISGGGAATFWIAAADERVRAAVPVSGMADLPSYVGHRVINGHCDCMFLYNTFQWPWTRIASLVAPRALLFANSDADPIFPMDANDRVINRLERVYSLHGRSDLADAMVSVGGHAYRQDLRQAAYRFINTHLKNDPRPVEDSEVDLITGERNDPTYPIPIDRLRVFPSDADIPADEWNTTLDEHFVPLAQVTPPGEGAFAPWKEQLTGDLRRVTFRSFPERMPAARMITGDTPSDVPSDARLETEPGIRIHLLPVTNAAPAAAQGRILLGVGDAEADKAFVEELRAMARPGDVVYLCEPRGMGATRWSEKNPPNYVQRSHVLLGQTVDTGRVRDVIATGLGLRNRHGKERPLIAVGRGASALLAAYGVLWEPEFSGAIVLDPPTTHGAPEAPQFLNILRVCDVPDMLGMLAPRALTVRTPRKEAFDKTAAIYRAAGAGDRLTLE